MADWIELLGFVGMSRSYALPETGHGEYLRSL